MGYFLIKEQKVSLTKIFNFDTPTNYTYNDTLIEIDSSVVSLIGPTFSITNPTISTMSIRSDLLESFTESSTKTGSDEIKYILSKDSIQYFYSGSWIVSDGTYIESNTASEISAQISTFTTEDVEV